MGHFFDYTFKPPADDPHPGPTIELSVEEIEDAALKEILQSQGARLGTWGMLNELLDSGPGTPFLFKQPLGQAREVKVALSGLFGRFVARAYLTRYFGLSVFANLGGKNLKLDGRLSIEVKRKRRARGDLPDWVACSGSLADLTVAEAKGCHDVKGPSAALGRAWKQANRVNVFVGSTRATLKRIAVATRWGAADGGAPSSRLSVHDPIEEGEPVEPGEMDRLYIGLLRLHISNLIEPLGHKALAHELRALVGDSGSSAEQATVANAQRVLDAARIHDVDGEKLDGDGLIGGIVTRAGPLAEINLSTVDQNTLRKLDLRPTYVGVEREYVQAAIKGDVSILRGRVFSLAEGAPARVDTAGGWVVDLGVNQRAVRLK